MSRLRHLETFGDIWRHFTFWLWPNQKSLKTEINGDQKYLTLFQKSFRTLCTHIRHSHFLMKYYNKLGGLSPREMVGLGCWHPPTSSPHHKIDRLLHDRWTLWNFSALEILSKRGRDPIRDDAAELLHKIPRKLIPFHVCIRKGQQPRKIPIIYLYCSHTQKMWTYLDLIFQYQETYAYATYGPEYL